MATEAPVYDLILLLDTTIEQERRDTILANVEDAIDRAGEIVGRHDWGNRHTVYEVHKHSEADYHLIQFRGTTALLEQLDHNLKITDGILRFRIIKLRPGTPAPPDRRARVVPPTKRGYAGWPRTTSGCGCGSRTSRTCRRERACGACLSTPTTGEGPTGC